MRRTLQAATSPIATLAVAVVVVPLVGCSGGGAGETAPEGAITRAGDLPSVSAAPDDTRESRAEPGAEPSIPSEAEVEACMRQRGWVAESPKQWSIPTDQTEVFQADLDECAPRQDPEDLRPTAEEAAGFYDAYLLINQCLDENGLPTEEPPMSREVFVEETVERIIPPWTPWDSLPLADQGRAEAACPPEDFGLRS